ncbi:hypothetical protein CDAR_321601 [Caerostris darwini]|uniref:Uncharacterized protein n=1 Tax=Caerostris darwini TaxID=1538125 RepID=A0AAV4MBQ1_9ARAC|nr:hypothetical protein CDAR_321601 [Caerostris darwini]
MVLSDYSPRRLQVNWARPLGDCRLSTVALECCPDRHPPLIILRKMNRISKRPIKPTYSTNAKFHLNFTTTTKFRSRPPSRQKRHLKSSVYLLASEPRKIFSQQHPRTAFDFLARSKLEHDSGEKEKKGNHLIKLLNRALTSLLHLEEKGRQKNPRCLVDNRL